MLIQDAPSGHPGLTYLIYNIGRTDFMAAYAADSYEAYVPSLMIDQTGVIREL